MQSFNETKEVQLIGPNGEIVNGFYKGISSPNEYELLVSRLGKIVDIPVADYSLYLNNGQIDGISISCIPDESKIYYTLISIIVSLIYKTLVLLCNNEPNKRLPYYLVFLLDEFANTPPLSDIETIVSVARSRGMYFQFFLQSFAQLDNLYGKEVSQIIQDNCGLAYLKTNTQETAEAISKRLGNKTIETNSLNYSMSFLNNNGSKGTSLIARNLMTADEIKQLHYKTIIFPTVGYPILRDTVIYSKFKCYKKDF